MRKDSEALLASGRKALEEGDWASARDVFRAVVDRGEEADGWYGLGEASWWLGDQDRALSCFERAYTAFRRRGEADRAAEMALRNALHAFANLANATAAAGWFARAKRLIEENELGEMRGELLVMQSCLAEDPADGEKDAREAYEMARREGNPDLELCSLSSIGVALVKQGRVREGLPLLDEAMACALSGEAERLETVVFTSCDLMSSCARCAAFEHAVECIRSAERFVRRYGCPFLYIECRVIYGEILFATGDWATAERELKTATGLADGSVPSLQRRAITALAELRLAQGRIEEAERLVAGFEGYAATVPVLARLHLLRADPVLAAVTVQRRLDVVGEEQLESARLVELLGEAELLQGNTDSAARRGRNLAKLGGVRDCRLVRACGERLLGRALAGTGSAGVRRRFDAALTDFVHLKMPYEAARTRLLLAAALRGDEPRVAAVEARAALGTLDELGAAREADTASVLLRELGAKATRSRPRGLRPLTRREREVFALLGEGLSNPEIARRLFISRKTVEHHVGHILAKLDLRSRAEAAAEAVRRIAKETVEK